jgi:RNA polymerase sigma factor (sigma-70 family)
MKQSRPSNVSSDVEPPQTSPPDVAAAPTRQRDDGPEAFVAASFGARSAEVFAFLSRSTRDPLLAEDLLRDVFRRLAKEARDGRPPLDVRAWLYRTASTEVIEHPRRQSRALRALSGGSRAQRDEAAVTSERATEMDRVLGGLSPEARLALLLSAEGFTGPEIATALGRPVESTRTLLGLARARVRVRRELFGEEAG